MSCRVVPCGLSVVLKMATCVQCSRSVAVKVKAAASASTSSSGGRRCSGRSWKGNVGRGMSGVVVGKRIEGSTTTTRLSDKAPSASISPERFAKVSDLCLGDGCLSDLRVDQLMTSTPISILEEDSVFEALRLMVENKISGLAVTDASGFVQGILSGYDILSLDYTPGHLDSSDGIFPALGKCDEYGGKKEVMWEEHFETQERMKRANGTTCGEVMHDTTLVTADASVAEAADLMVQKKLHRLAIVDPSTNKLVGMLSRGDVMRATWKYFQLMAEQTES